MLGDEEMNVIEPAVQDAKAWVKQQGFEAIVDGPCPAESAFRIRSAGRRIIHVASHGLVVEHGRRSHAMLIFRAQDAPTDPHAIPREQFVSILPHSLPWR